MLDRHSPAIPDAQPTGFFTGFPYLVTRIAPAVYHIIVLPDELDEAQLLEIARQQAAANARPTCLVCAADSAIYIGADGRESRGEPPSGGFVITGGLEPCRVFPETPSLAARRRALNRFIARRMSQIYGMSRSSAKGRRPAAS
jgi:hypothetical protein